MAQILIVRAHDQVDGDCVEYLGVSRHFEELGEADAIPEYAVEFQRVRTCNACGGTDWGPAPTMEIRPTEIVCKGCGAPVELSHFVDHLKAVRRMP